MRLGLIDTAAAAIEAYNYILFRDTFPWPKCVLVECGEIKGP